MKNEVVTRNIYFVDYKLFIDIDVDIVYDRIFVLQVTPAFHPAEVSRARATSTGSGRWTLLTDPRSYPLRTLFVLLTRRSALCRIVAYRRSNSMAAARHKAALPRRTRRPCTPGPPGTVYPRQI